MRQFSLEILISPRKLLDTGSGQFQRSEFVSIPHMWRACSLSDVLCHNVCFTCEEEYRRLTCCFHMRGSKIR